ncbi:hypothetical protein FRC09_016948 [Ceratobasidium sp. 395]|nr:hypothetical protein FRC09_016948 [Ceratobasidium sp. 395]
MHNDPSLDDTESTISSPSTEDLTALQLLLGYIELEFTNVTAQVDALMIRGEEHITWSLLWAICERGKLMRIASKSFGDEPLAFETTGWEYRAKKRSSRGQVVQSGTAEPGLSASYLFNPYLREFERNS